MNPPIERLEARLDLSNLLLNLLGFEDFPSLREYTRLGGSVDNQSWNIDGHTPLYKALEAAQHRRVPADQLAAYDVQIKGYMNTINRFRTPPITLKYFQYLAVLLGEVFLDMYFHDQERLLAELATVRKAKNSQGFELPTPSIHDLNKIAYWMATGSGKTLIMHINLLQFQHYAANKLEFENAILVTPDPGLSKQHLEEFSRSGIAARHFHEAGTIFTNSDGPVVTVIEITKLTETKKGSGLSVEVDAFGKKNVLLVDEGHRGARGEVWRNLRSRLAEEGFTFEYSATFGQTVNGASSTQRADLLCEYSNSIVLDYSYPHFYQDGYGKDYSIMNVKGSGGDFSLLMEVGNLLSFYEQLLLFETNGPEFDAYNIERPLWVYVGHSVTSGRSKDDKASLTDVEEVVKFLADYLAQRDRHVKLVERILGGKSGLVDEAGQDIFQGMFVYLKSKGMKPEEVYDNSCERLFHASPGTLLSALRIIQSDGEIGLRAGADKPYFAVINIGDVKGLVDRMRQKGMDCADESLHGSLFDEINATKSPINVLIGSKKFMEGWDSFRVSSMGLLNIGRGEGSQIIQLFGRGVRLWGKDRSLKRSSSLPGSTHPSDIVLLETLRVFGIRANYMAQFRSHLEEEGVDTDNWQVEVPIEIENSLLERGLQMLRVEQGKDFALGAVVRPSILAEEVVLDLVPLVERASSDAEFEPEAYIKGVESSAIIREYAPCVTWQRIEMELSEFRRLRGYSNLLIDREALRAIIAEGKYKVFVAPGRLDIMSFRDLDEVEYVTVSLLKKYISRCVEIARRVWEKDNLTFTELRDDDPNLSFQSYSVRGARDLIADAEKLLHETKEIYLQDVTQLPNIHFDRHIYQPLLIEGVASNFHISPPPLNEGETEFVSDLRTYLGVHPEKLEGSELFLLRNLTRGKGVGFFDLHQAETFFPDFILWLLRPEHQMLIFIDPHGLIHAKGGFNDPKITVHRDLEALATQIQGKVAGYSLSMTSFIISTSEFQVLSKRFGDGTHTVDEFEENHVLFQSSDGEYIGKMLELALHQGKWTGP